MRALLALAIAASIAVAGCSGGSDDDTNPTTTAGGGGGGGGGTTGARATTGAGTTQAGTTSSGGGGAGTGDNTAPTGSIATSAATGGAPLNVTFTLAATDQDGDDLSWSLDLGDGSAKVETPAPATFPATVAHEYAAEGLFTVVYTVSDGTDSSSFDVTINVTAAGGAQGQQFSASWPGSATPQECALGFSSALQGVTWVEMAVEPATVGKDFTADFTSTGQPVCAGISWFGADGWLGDTGGLNSPAGGNSFNGQVPDGAERAIFFYTGGFLNAVEYTAG